MLVIRASLEFKQREKKKVKGEKKGESLVFSLGPNTPKIYSYEIYAGLFIICYNLRVKRLICMM